MWLCSRWEPWEVRAHPVSVCHPMGTCGAVSPPVGQFCQAGVEMQREAARTAEKDRRLCQVREVARLC